MKKENYNWGKTEPFFPDFIFKEAVAGLLAFIVVMLFAAFAHVPLEPVADPTDTTYIPRPEWYFMFLFQLLKYFPGELEAFAVFVIPTIGILLLILLPFYDTRKERRPSARPLASAAATLALVGVVYLTGIGIVTTPAPAISEALPPVRLTAAESAGKKLYQEQGCSGCHKPGGGPAPDLSRIGSQRDAEYLEKYLRNPKDVNAASVMPPFGSLGEEKLRQIVQYMLTLR